MAKKHGDLLAMFRRGTNHFNHADPSPVTAEPVTMPAQAVANLVRMGGSGQMQKPYVAQIQVNVLKFYFTEALGVYTQILPAALNAQLKVDLPFFMFLQSDLDAGYAKLKNSYALQGGWQYGVAQVVGRQFQLGTAGLNFDSNVTSLLRDGDVIVPFYATVGGTNYVAVVVVRTADVAYSTLLGSTSSNTFTINMLRYDVVAGQEAQFSKAVLIANQTMFGRFTSDPINPRSFKSSWQNQDNIIDIDITVGINKQVGFQSTAAFDVVDFTWNLFIESVTKIV